MTYARVLARRLTELGYSVTVVPRDVPLTGDLNVRGKITDVDAGSTAKRVLIGMGAGHSEFDVYGTVTKADGSLVGEFTESRAGGGWGEERAIEGAMERTAVTIGRMIYTGEYRRNAPPDRSSAKAFAAEQPTPTAMTGSVRDRLQTLDALRADGTISDQEYQTKRRAILDGL
jgi:hypothetical protein